MTTPAVAGTGEEIAVLPTLDPLNRTENPLSNNGKWSALSWTSGTKTGRDTTSGWGPYDAYPVVNGAYWNPSTFSDAKTGDAAAITMQIAPGIENRYLALWLNMSNPGSSKTGYQLRWIVNPGTLTYTVKLSKWSSGTETVLASNASVSIPVGTTLAISDTGETVTAWQGTGGSLTSLLSATDSTFNSGYAGIEGTGNISRSINFKAGVLLGGRITSVSVLDNLERNELPLANGKWSKPTWASEIGGAWCCSGYHGYGSNTAADAAAYWNQSSFSDGEGGVLVGATVGSGAAWAGERLALWLNMPTPGSARSGYEARFEGVNGSASNYKVELSKWVSGTRTVLASKSGFSLPVGTTIALTDSGGSLALWTGTSSFTPVVSANDSTYSSGYAGLEVYGVGGTEYNFRAGRIKTQAPDTSITSGPAGTVLPNVSFSFTATESGSTFECSLDGAAFSACTSPKGYQGLAEGSHTFRVRATNAAGNPDDTPAERSFQVLAVGTALTKVPLWDNLERQEVPLATGKWSKSSWAGEIGGAWCCGYYRGYGSSGSALAAAYWNPTIFYGFAEQPALVSAIVGTGATPSGQRLALWLDMPDPGTSQSGYEARFEGVNGSASNYKVEVSKWVSGTRTVLASTSGFSLPVGTVMVLEDSGSTLNLWTGTSSFSTVLSATDTTYSAGYAGLEVNGGAGTEYSFRAGNIDLQPPDTTITSGPSGKVPPDVLFSFTASETGSTFECSLDGAAFSACTSPQAYQGSAEGTHLFRVRATDMVGNQDPSPAERSFEVVNPPETTITSPQPSYTSHETWPITFASDEAGSTFKCSFDAENEDSPNYQPLAPCSSPYTMPQNLAAGWHTFVVVATDTEGNTDPTPAKWTFNLAIYPPAPSTSTLVSPEEGERSSSYYSLKAKWGSAPSGGGVTGVTFQVRQNIGGTLWSKFKTIPAQYVTDAKGQQVSWPLPVSENPGESEPVYFNAADYPSFTNTIFEARIMFRAVFDGGVNAAGASKHVNTELSVRWGTSRTATQTIGPAGLDLLTGQYTISRTDVSIPVPGSESNLEFTRVYDSGYAGQNGTSKLLGGPWQPSTPVEQAYAGHGWHKVVVRHQNAIPPYEEEGEIVEGEIPAADWAEVVDNEGMSIAFDLVGGSYVSPDYARELELTKEEATFALVDPDGTRTVFVENEVGPSDEYRVDSVSWQATPKSARMVYEKSGGEHRLSKIIAPSAPGVTCTDQAATTTPGCRTLTFQYLEGNTDPQDRLSSITYHNATGSGSQIVAKYSYDSAGRLVEVWDPRILPNLKEAYGYVGEYGSQLETLTPPGEEPWQFAYYPDYSFGLSARPLKSVSRASLLESPSTATTTIVYDVPISGEGAPYDMSPATVAKWGQSDYPVDATAIFPANQVPSDPPSDYSYASVRYMDPDGYEVNTASPAPPGVSGASIATSETDSHGNVVRSLSPQNRLRALEAADTVARSKELDSHSTYSADGTEMLESWGPLHKVRLESGQTVEARTHTTVKYDEGAPTPPAGTPWPHLPTKETVAAAIPGQADADPRVSETKYDWTLRKATEEIVDPSGLNLRTKTVYDSATGQVTEERRPANTAGGDAHTTKTVYYSAGPVDEYNSCGNQAARAGLPCVTMPAAAPSPAEGNPGLPWTWFTSWSNLDQPTEIQEKAGGFIKRLTTTTYDAAGRIVKTKQTGEGTSVPAVETTYDEYTGAPTTQKFVCEAPESCTGFDNQQVTTTYDKLGRPISYEDADGNVSGATFDLMGRPVLVSDGKGTQTITYDEKSGLPVKVVDSAAGTFTAAYDIEGKLTEQILPNGLAQQITYDVVGTPVNLRYQKLTGCSTNCTWLQFSREESIGGQVLKETGTLETKEYSYDKAGRLTLAKETPTGQGCTTRSYAFDKDSNRTSLTTRSPGAGGACDTSSEGTKTTYSYDSADGLIGTGVTYDGLGRITSLPSAYSGGGTLTTTYYVNDLTRSQTQDGLTNTYELDAALRQRQRTQSGSKSGTEIYHYAGGSDSPVWTQEGTAWTRNIAALGGSLGALQKSTGETTLQLADLHGDIVATASLDPYATNVLSTQRFDEFGNPKQSTGAKYGWLGANGRRTELPSGVIQMGVRSYVPALGRFLTPDPIVGGSANAYDYANQDPVNQFDLNGEASCNKAQRKQNPNLCGRCPPGDRLCHMVRRTVHKTRHMEKRAGIGRIVCYRCSKSKSAGEILDDAAGKVGNITKGAAGTAIKIVYDTLIGRKLTSASEAWRLVKPAIGVWLSTGQHAQSVWACAKSATMAFFQVAAIFEDSPATAIGYIATSCAVEFA